MKAGYFDHSLIETILMFDSCNDVTELAIMAFLVTLEHKMGITNWKVASSKYFQMTNFLKLWVSEHSLYLWNFYRYSAPIRGIYVWNHMQNQITDFVSFSFTINKL